jgi:hypothetical protein
MTVSYTYRPDLSEQEGIRVCVSWCGLAHRVIIAYGKLGTKHFLKRSNRIDYIQVNLYIPANSVYTLTPKVPIALCLVRQSNCRCVGNAIRQLLCANLQVCGQHPSSSIRKLNMGLTYLPILHVLQAVLHSSKSVGLYENRDRLDLSRSEDLFEKIDVPLAVFSLERG